MISAAAQPDQLARSRFVSVTESETFHHTARMLLGEITQHHSMSTKRGRVRRHSISSLEEAAKKVAQEPSSAEATMPSFSEAGKYTIMSQDRSRKRPLPVDAASDSMSPAKKIALLTGGVTMEDLLKNAPSSGTSVASSGGDQYLCLPGGK